jgi:hypothetical protein
MQSIEFEYAVTFGFAGGKDSVVALFSDVENLIGCTSELESCVRVGHSTYAWTLAEKRELGLVFQPKYTLEYIWEGDDRLRWSTVGYEAESNIQISACIDFVEDAPGSCRVHVQESISFDLPISFITAKIVKAIARREAESDMKGLLDRLNASQALNSERG